VIVPVYNSERYLIPCINSVLNQTYKNIEIIVVNDGSTDNSEKILKSYSDKIILLSQPNKGLDSALNTAINTMSGKWLKWFSPDDVMYPDAIKILVNTALKQQENTILYSNWDVIDDSENFLRHFYESNFNDLKSFDYNVRLLEDQRINVNTCLIPKNIFDQGCLFRKIKDPVAIDYDFFLRAGLLYDARFHLVEKFLIKYRIHKNQFSRKNISQSLCYLSELKNEILSNLNKETRRKYLLGWTSFRKNLPIKQKLMKLGLDFAVNYIPTSLTDKLLIFYLNKIRRNR